jgi:hypothetical protein
MSSCPNINHPVFIDTVKAIGKINAYTLYEKMSNELVDKHPMYYKLLNNNDVYTTIQTIFNNTINPTRNVFYQNNSNQSKEDYVVAEKVIKDVAARMSNRIGIDVKFESDRTKDYKGKLQGNTAVINLAHATLDTPIHEIVGHPIIRAIKHRKNIFNTGDRVYYQDFDDIYTIENVENVGYDFTLTLRDDKNNVMKADVYEVSKVDKNLLYENLLQELEYGKGKEVLDRVKRNYTNKNNLTLDNLSIEKYSPPFNENVVKYRIVDKQNPNASYTTKDTLEEAQEVLNRITKVIPYTLEEQQEEAIVELLGLMTAEKLDNVKDGKLISLLKRLLKEMKAYMRLLFNQKEIQIDKLPDNMTINDLADLLAYSNSKLILPGYEVEYTTPDNMKFKTYQEASNHISELTKLGEVDLDKVKIGDKKESIVYNVINNETGDIEQFNTLKEAEEYKENVEYEDVVNTYTIREEKRKSDLYGFIDKNKPYEQSKEIIEEWKKVNNIQYNPKEVYSRGQEFVSVVGAYSSFDVNLMMQNLLSHIEDNEKAGGKFAISAFTKPIDKTIGHLEGGGGKIKFKIYPKSEDILWAANTDVYSGSVWDASETVSKDKKSELLGVSYTKYPSLRGLNAVKPNLASIIDDLAHHHNELGITLTGNNFRIEYDETIPYTTKKIIDGINSILDQKYGKLFKPDIKKGVEKRRKTYSVHYKENNYEQYRADSKEEAESFIKRHAKNWKKDVSEYYIKDSFVREGYEGVAPVKNEDNLQASIGSVKEKLNENNLQDEDMPFAPKEQRKQYTSQALINTKIAALKQSAKKYPRILIRSNVVPISSLEYDNTTMEDGLFFQKVNEDLPSGQITSKVDKSNSFKELRALTAKEKTVFTSKGVYTMRTSGNKHFGNPFTGTKSVADKNPNLILMPSVEEAVQAYKDWLLNGVSLNLLPEANIDFTYSPDIDISNLKTTDEKSILNVLSRVVTYYKKAYPTIEITPNIIGGQNELGQSKGYNLAQKGLEILNNKVKEVQRQWILDQINQGKLDNATLLYMNDRTGYKSHADALLEAVQELRKPKESSTNQEDLPGGPLNTVNQETVNALSTKQIEFGGSEIVLSTKEELEILNIGARLIARFKQMYQNDTSLDRDTRADLVSVLEGAKEKLKSSENSEDNISFLDRAISLILNKDSSLFERILYDSEVKYGREAERFVVDNTEDVDVSIENESITSHKDYNADERYGKLLSKTNDIVRREINNIPRNEPTFSKVFRTYFDFNDISGTLIKFLRADTVEGMLNRADKLAIIDPTFKHLVTKLHNDERFQVMIYNYSQKFALEADANFVKVTDGKIRDFKLKTENLNALPDKKLGRLYMANFKAGLNTNNLILPKTQEYIDLRLTDLETHLKVNDNGTINNAEAAQTIIELFNMVKVNIPSDLLQRYINAFVVNDSLDINDYNSKLISFYADLKSKFITLNNYAKDPIFTEYGKYVKLKEQQGVLNSIAEMITEVDTNQSDITYLNIKNNLRSAIVPKFPLGEFFAMMKDANSLKDFITESLQERGIEHSNWLINNKFIIPKAGQESIVYNDQGVPVLFDINTDLINKVKVTYTGGTKNTITNDANEYVDFSPIQYRVENLVRYTTTKKFNKRGSTPVSTFTITTPSEGSGFQVTVPITTISDTFYNEYSTGFTTFRKLLVENKPIIAAYMRIFDQEVARIAEANERIGRYFDGTYKSTDPRLPRMQLGYDYKINKDGIIERGKVFDFNVFPFLNDVIKNRTSLTISDVVKGTQNRRNVINAVVGYMEQQAKKTIERYKEVEKHLDEYYGDTDAMYNDAIEATFNYFITQNELSNFVFGKLAEFKDFTTFTKRNKKTQTIGEYYAVYEENDNNTYYTINFKDFKVISSVFESLGIEATDAQSILTSRGYRDKLKRRGNLTPEKEQAISNIEKGLPNTTPLPQLKNFSSSYNFDPAIGRRVSKQDKNSEVFLHSNMFPNTQLQELMQFIEELEDRLDAVVQINFSSGEKHGSINAIDIYDKDGNISLTDEVKRAIEDNLDTRHYKDLREQLSVHSESKNGTTNAGKQLDKIVLTNLSTKAVYEFDGQTIDGKEFIKTVFDIRDANILESYNDTEFKFTDENGEITEKSLSDFIQDFGIKQGWNDNVLNAISTEERNGQIVFNIHPSFNGVTSKLQEVITSAFTNNVIRQQLPGTHLYQAARLFMDTVATNKESVLSLDDVANPNSITWIDGKIKKLKYSSLNGKKSEFVEVLLPATYKEIINQDGSIDVENIDPKSLEMLGYRIPTEGKYSTVVMKVVGFLPESMGTAVVLPDEWVGQSGSDFDIDSLYVYNYHVDKGGSVIPYLTDNNSTVEERFKSVPTNFTTKDFSDTLKALEKEHLENTEKVRQKTLKQINDLFNTEFTDFKEGFDYLFKQEQLQRSVLAFQKHEDKKAKIQKEIDKLVEVRKAYTKPASEAFKEQYNKEFKEFRAKRFEEFKTLSIPQQNNRQARDNALISLYMEALKNPVAHSEIKERSNFEDVEKARDDVWEITGNAGTSLHPFDMHDQEDNTNALAIGARLKGQSVNLDSLTSILNTIGEVKFIGKEDIPVKLDVKEVEKFGKDKVKELFGEDFNEKTLVLNLTTLGTTSTGSNKNLADKFITTFNAQTTANILDIAKEVMLSTVNNNTITVFKMFQMVGMHDYGFVSHLFEQRNIKRFIDSQELENSIYKTNDFVFNNVYSELVTRIARLEEEVKQEQDPNYVPKDIKPVFVNNSVIAAYKENHYFVPSKQDLIKQLKNLKVSNTFTKKQALNFNKKELGLLNYFHDILQKAKDIESLNRGLRFDKTQVGPTFAETIKKLDDVKQAYGKFTKDGTDLMEAIYLSENSVYQPLKTYREVFKKVYENFGKFFITETAEMNRLAEHIPSKYKQAFKSYTVKSFLTGSYNTTTFFGHLEDNLAEQQRILGLNNVAPNISINTDVNNEAEYAKFRRLSTAKKLEVLQQSHNSELLNALKHVPEINRIYDYIELDISYDDNILTTDYKRMLNSNNIFIKDFAFDLIAYDYLVNGLKWGTGIAKLIPFEVFKSKNTFLGNLDINSSLRDIHNKLEDDKLRLDDNIVVSFYRSNYSNSELVPAVSKKLFEKIAGNKKITYDELPSKLKTKPVVKYETEGKVYLYQKSVIDNNVYFTRVNKLEPNELGDLSYNEDNNDVEPVQFSDISFSDTKSHIESSITHVLKKQLTEANLSRKQGQVNDNTINLFFNLTKKLPQNMNRTELEYSFNRLAYNRDVVEFSPFLAVLEQEGYTTDKKDIKKIPTNVLRSLVSQFQDYITEETFSLDYLPIYTNVEDLDVQDLATNLGYTLKYNLRQIELFESKLKNLKIDKNTLDDVAKRRDALSLLLEVQRLISNYTDFQNLYTYKKDDEELSEAQQRLNRIILKARDVSDKVLNLEVLQKESLNDLYTLIIKENTTNSEILNAEKDDKIIQDILHDIQDVDVITRGLNTAFDTTDGLLSNIMKEIRSGVTAYQVEKYDLYKRWSKISPYLKGKNIFKILKKNTQDNYYNEVDLDKVNDYLGEEAVEFFERLKALASDINPDGVVAQGGLPEALNAKRGLGTKIAQDVFAFYDTEKGDTKYEYRDSHNTKYKELRLPFDKEVSRRDKISIPDRIEGEREDVYEERALEEIKVFQNKEFKDLKAVYKYNKKVDKFNSKLSSNHLDNIRLDMDNVLPIYIDKLSNARARKDNVDLLRLIITDIKTRKEGIARNESTVNKAASLLSVSTGKRVSGTDANITKQLEWVLDNYFYGDSNRTGNLGTKVGRSLRHYTSLKGMGLNVFSGVNNFIYGSLQTRLKSFGGDDYSAEDWNAGKKMYRGKRSQNIMSYITDTIFDDKRATTLESGLINLFDILYLQNELPSNYSVDRNYQSKLNESKKVLSKNLSLHVFNNMGEHALQNGLLFAMLNSHRLIDGRLVSFANFVESKEQRGKGRTIEEKRGISKQNKELVKQAKEEFENYPKGIELFELDEVGYISWNKDELSEKEFGAFREKILRKNHELHGIYNQEDLSLISAYELGRLALIFRKWIKPGWDKRFGSKFLKDAGYNELRQKNDYGTYSALYDFLRTPLIDAVQTEERTKWGQLLKYF